MSLKLNNAQQIPEATVRVARAAFPKGDNVYMKIRDECGVVYQDEQFADLFGVRGKPAEAPGRLALVTIMQYAEGMTDREAADAVRSRIDWKYALGLPLEDSGFHYSVLSKFRRRLLGGSAEERLLDLTGESCWAGLPSLSPTTQCWLGCSASESAARPAQPTLARCSAGRRGAHHHRPARRDQHPPGDHCQHGGGPELPGGKDAPPRQAHAGREFHQRRCGRWVIR